MAFRTARKPFKGSVWHQARERERACYPDAVPPKNLPHEHLFPRRPEAT
jgi:hypothetical protein